MKWKRVSGVAILFIILSSCNIAHDSRSTETVTSPSGSLVKYAHGFDLYDEGSGCYQVIVYHPDQMDEVLFSCRIVPDSMKTSGSEIGLTLRSPLDSVAVFSATQLNGFGMLNLFDKVIGVSEAKYISNSLMKRRLEEGKTFELGNNGAFFVERTLALHPQAIFYSPYQLNQAHPLAASQQLMIPFLDFMETDPLGRAEWIKFTAAFMGNFHEADSLFQHIVFVYDSLKLLVGQVNDRPTVMSDKYFADQWYVPGGKSYIATMIADAGGSYIWQDDEHVASFPLDVETVLSQAAHADYWRIVGTYEDAPSYEKLGNENELYIHFDAFKNRKVLFCDSRKTGYFEQGPLEPQVQLADLIFAFHPDLLEGYVPVYYQLIP